MTATTFKLARQEAGLSVSGVADVFGVTRQTVHNWEADRTPTPPWVFLALAGYMAARDCD